ncbi:DUF2829 domain-containing protein [Anoxybacillus kestanbolensis]|nr:DUF2829 domain-containing protein [Anoxybacillus kestanbolensis]
MESMNIQEATKLALEKGLCITRTGDELYKFMRIKPTDTPDCCIVFPSPEYERIAGKKISPAKRWNPKAEDLLADDWIVIGLET